MYINLVNEVLVDALNDYIAKTGKDRDGILKAVREHIDKTSVEHQRDHPDIDYDDALCRLGYLYRHATANATLFQWVLGLSLLAKNKIAGADRSRLRVCAVGGGPGTELLGLAKHLSQTVCLPSRIDFTVLDKVPQWAETWTRLAEAVEGELGSLALSAGRAPPVVSSQFLPMDVLEEDSYSGYGTYFRNADLIVFNYLFSENKGSLSESAAAVEHLVDEAKPGCVFVVIDRLENAPGFQSDVAELFRSVGLDIPDPIPTIGSYLDGDEQVTDMEATFRTILGYPRIKFFTAGYRNPTVFWFAAEKK